MMQLSEVSQLLKDPRLNEALEAAANIEKTLRQLGNQFDDRKAELAKVEAQCLQLSRDGEAQVEQVKRRCASLQDSCEEDLARKRQDSEEAVAKLLQERTEKESVLQELNDLLVSTQAKVAELRREREAEERRVEALRNDVAAIRRRLEG